MSKHFLFLQGVCSPFFDVLGNALHAAGHQVSKINFNAGDTLYWGKLPAIAYRERIEHLPGFLAHHYQTQGITDILVFGDCRPVHRVAIAEAKAAGIRVHVMEEGYFRPHWVTLESDGVNGRSLLPRDAHWYRDVASRLGVLPEIVPFRSSFLNRAWHDVRYHVEGIRNPIFYAGYQTHAVIHAPREYAGYIHRLSAVHFRKKTDQRAIDQLVSSRAPFYLLPLQLNGDAQITAYSRFSNMLEVMEEVMGAFALHAPSDAKLVIKNHPLDMWMIYYPRHMKALIKRFALEGRVIYLESGNMDQLLAHTRGVITVNSTVGLQAVMARCPTLTLADPIYNIAGLTSQLPLSAFFTEAVKPDHTLAKAFRRVVIGLTQVNGGFYSREGIKVGVEHCIPLLTAEQSLLEHYL